MEVKQERGSQTLTINGQEEGVQIIQVKCPIHGKIAGRWFPNGRVECPECAVIQAKRDALATGIPFRFILKSMRDYFVSSEEQENALKTAKGYAENFDLALQDGAGLVFLGGVGTGKTHLACAIANHVRASERSVIYSTVRQAVGLIKNTWSHSSQVNEADVLARFITPDLLVLDEVGIQFGSEAERIVLYDIIDGRYGRVRPTIVISNLSFEELQRTLGLRIVDRMREHGQLVLFNWESHRR